MHTIPIFSEKRCQLIYNNRNTDIGESKYGYQKMNNISKQSEEQYYDNVHWEYIENLFCFIRI